MDASKKEGLHVQHRRLTITIDGPAGVGKSTTAKALAKRLGYAYLDTGALYRAVAWKIQAEHVDPSNSEKIETILPNTKIQLVPQDQQVAVFVDSQEVTQELRNEEISRLASQIAVLPGVRAWLLPIQREFGREGGIVAEGRDMGTRVFPEAEVKFFLEADPAVRATRRYQELREHRLQPVGWEEVHRELIDRDARDRHRDIAPLVPADDAVVIDTSNLSVEDVLDRMMKVVSANR